MAAPIIIDLPDGKKLYFGGEAKTGLAEVSARAKLAKITSEQFQAAMGSLGELVKILEASVGNLPKRPDKIEMEFGAKLSTDCNLWIVSGEGEAEFKIKLSWEGDKSESLAGLSE
ncbi:MAG TPA: CU044_2847 family protein [Methylocella sp.]|nr:CU044_2847 family protein [Methylocella sp.]